MCGGFAGLFLTSRPPVPFPFSHTLPGILVDATLFLCLTQPSLFYLPFIFGTLLKSERRLPGSEVLDESVDSTLCHMK